MPKRLIKKTAKCKTCLTTKPKIPYGNRKDRPEIIYKDDVGKWNGRVCSSCKSRVAGHLELRYVTNPAHVRARASEKIAANHFRNLGYFVRENSRPTGPDLLIFHYASAKRYTCEVKTVTRHGNLNTWSVGYVDKLRQNDDFIAYVFDSRVLAVEAMKNHLRYCGKSGRRTVTAWIQDPKKEQAKRHKKS